MKPIFRNSMLGFHKEDVFNFISKQGRQYESKINDLTEENSRVEALYEKEKEQARLYSDKLQSFRLEYERFQDVILKIRSELDQVRKAKDEVVRCADLCEEQNSGAKSAFDDMGARLEKAQFYREKAMKFDQLSNVLSSFIVGNGSSDNDSASEANLDGYEKIPAFPENNEIENLRKAVEALSACCDALDEIVGETK